MGGDLAVHVGVHDHLIVEPVDAVVQHGPVGADLDTGGCAGAVHVAARGAGELRDRGVAAGSPGVLAE